MNFLFVCSGNTCRSPLAVAAWQAFASPLLGAASAGASVVPPITVASAGLTATPDAGASPHTLDIARDWGVDLRAHRARRLTAQIVAEAQVICVMTSDQLATLRLRFDTAPHQAYLLGEFAPQADDPLARLTASDGTWFDVQTSSRANQQCSILDPYGGSIEAYQTCATQIRAAVTGLAQALLTGALNSLREERDA